ncbi:aminoglycoside phosphotransferase family protein [Bacillus sp. FJAT-50079]|uniref:phosphotransferase family protein n=1 Tax=Bacillus sp. FJAT-50079 TaxID=2833577 RepID=UPI001BC8E034|nr:aminoglycoside phosphotransferase family protein [Bacillus sp. FJAT-50079]MBS4210020.1 aminoglycoside phosphotransferase family protein [Bacillus sp. FJAT-50079]
MRALSVQLENWVLHSVGEEASICSIQRLFGGTSSLVHQLTLQSGGETFDVVLRQFTNKQWLEEEPDLALHEAESLRLASHTKLETPQLIAFDEIGREAGVPAVLMSMLEGTVVLEPENTHNWTNELAQTLVNIHQQDADEFAWSYYTYKDLAALEIPNWSSLTKEWKDAFRIVKGPRPEVRNTFIHRDYHPANVLWLHHSVSGVVDWVNACRGPAGIDVGHCRLNLAMLHGVQVADHFLSAYEKHASASFSYDPYWDLLSIIDILFDPPEVFPGWIELGVTGLTDAIVRERLEAYLVSVLKAR